MKAAKAEQRATEKAVEASTRAADEAAAQNPPTAPAFAPPDRLSKPWRDLTDQTQTAYKPRSLHLDSPPEYPEMPMLQRDPKATGEFLNALDALAALSTLDVGTMLGASRGASARQALNEARKGNTIAANDLALSQYQIALSRFSQEEVLYERAHGGDAMARWQLARFRARTESDRLTQLYKSVYPKDLLKLKVPRVPPTPEQILDFWDVPLTPPSDRPVGD